MWTYDGVPGTDTADKRRDAVRLLVGDTDTNDQQIQDAEITFALSQSNDDVYGAGAIIARAIAGKYARLVDTSIDSVKASYSQRSADYFALAVRLDRDSKMKGGSLGLPRVGGVSESTMDSVEDNSDRVDSRFKTRQFSNPPDSDDPDSWWEYHN